MTCATCKFSSAWSRTPTGRIREAAGRCTWQLGALVLPIVVKVLVQRVAIWPNEGDDCPTYETGAPQR